MKKKLVAIISVVAMLVTMIPATVFADGSELVDSEGALKEAIKKASEDNETIITLSASFTVESPIEISGDKNIVIDLNGNTITASDNLSNTTTGSNAPNVVEIISGAKVTVKGGTIKAGANTKHIVNIFEAGNIVLENLTLDRTAANQPGAAGTGIGAPLIISGTDVTINDKLELIEGDCSWYGMNIDSSSGTSKSSNVTISEGATVTGDIWIENTKATGVTAGVKLINNGTIDGSAGVKKTDGNGNVTLENKGEVTGQIAVNSGATVTGNGTNGGMASLSTGKEANVIAPDGTVTEYETIKQAVEIATAGSIVTVLKDDVIVDTKLTINKNLTLDLNGKTITASDSLTASSGDPNVIDVVGGNVTIKNGTVVAGIGTKHVLNIWNAGEVTLEGLELDHTNSTYINNSKNPPVPGGAPLIVTGTDVTVNGTLDLVTGTNSWYGMNVDSRDGHNAVVTVNIGAAINGSIKIENTGAGTNTSEVTNNGTINGDIEVAGEGSTLTNNTGAIVNGKVTETNGGDTTNDGTIKDPNASTPSNPGGTVTPSVTKSRVAGDDRFQTAIKVADKLKSELGVVKFNNIVVANSDEFADALSATALAADKDAPILVVNKNNESTVKTYIANNLNKGGNVYIIGGTAVVSESFEKSLTNCKVTRLGGSDRYETNLEVLKTLGVTGASDIMVASGLKYPDALSASATGNPVLLVGKTLTDNQKAYLATLGGNDDYYVIGETAAVNATVMNQLKASKLGTVTRLGGDTRYETGLAVAEEFFTNARTAVIASGDDFPDGLTGGVLANAMNAPLMLVNQYNTDVAADFVDDNSVRTVIAIGGTTVIPDATLNKVA